MITTVLLLGLVLAGLMVLATVLVSRRPEVVGRRFDGRLQLCPPSPNCVCSEDARDGARIAPLEFPGDPDRAWPSLVEFLDNEANATLVEVTEEYLHAVYRTTLLRFADDVEFRLDRQDGVIHVRSASRVGHSDLGANRARIEDLRRRWAPPED